MSKDLLREEVDLSNEQIVYVVSLEKIITFKLLKILKHVGYDTRRKFKEYRK